MNIYTETQEILKKYTGNQNIQVIENINQRNIKH